MSSQATHVTGQRTPADLSSGLDRCRRPAAEALCLPPACYASDAVVPQEVEQVFRNGWIGIGRADRVKAAGDFAAIDIAGTPLILNRDAGKRLRAFANSCRHRGTRLVSGEGNAKGFRCPFHSWTYRLDGTLAAAPQLDAVKGFERSENGLVEYRAEERAGFAFVSFETNPAPLDDQLGDFEALHAPWSLGRLVTTRRRELEVGCNWKAFLDVFNEYYHLGAVHPNSINNLYEMPDPGEAVTGEYASQFGETSGTGALLQDQQNQALPAMPGLTGRPSRGARYTWVFPSMTFASGKEAVWIYEAYPMGANRCRVVQSICFAPETIALADFEERAAFIYLRLDAAIDEDIIALENQQLGLASPDARAGRFSAATEPNVAAFGRWYAGRMLAGSN